jgi:hypothetical protein
MHGAAALGRPKTQFGADRLPGCCLSLPVSGPTMHVESGARHPGLALPAGPASPMRAALPADPASPMRAALPADPASPMRAALPADPASPMRAANSLGARVTPQPVAYGLTIVGAAKGSLPPTVSRIGNGSGSESNTNSGSTSTSVTGTVTYVLGSIRSAAGLLQRVGSGGVAEANARHASANESRIVVG